MQDYKIFTGNSNRVMALKLAKALGVTLGRIDVMKFSDGEARVEIMEHVRGQEVFIVQSTCSPTNDNLMELLLMVDAFKRAAVKRIVAVVPYFGYARQDRRPGSARVPITAKLVASMLETAGVDHIITIDIHANQIQGFFNIPVDNISAIPIFAGDIYQKWITEDKNKTIIVSPDVGGVTRARLVAKHLDLDLAIIDKRRPKANVAEVMNIIGDVDGKVCIIVDDLIDTAGTLCGGAEALKSAGAKTVVAYATHPVLSGSAYENLHSSTDVLQELVVTNTIQLSNKAYDVQLRQLSVTGILAEAIHRVHKCESVSSISFD
jgi:ribose-phosphate pyrophosphokinase